MKSVTLHSSSLQQGSGASHSDSVPQVLDSVVGTRPSSHVRVQVAPAGLSSFSGTTLPSLLLQACSPLYGSSGLSHWEHGSFSHSSSFSPSPSHPSLGHPSHVLVYFATPFPHNTEHSPSSHSVHSAQAGFPSHASCLVGSPGQSPKPTHFRVKV